MLATRRHLLTVLLESGPNRENFSYFVNSGPEADRLLSMRQFPESMVVHIQDNYLPQSMRADWAIKLITIEQQTLITDGVYSHEIK